MRCPGSWQRSNLLCRVQLPADYVIIFIFSFLRRLNRALAEVGAVFDGVNQLLFTGDQFIRHTLQILNDIKGSISPQIVQRLHHGDLRIVSGCAHIHGDIQPQMAEDGKIKILYHTAASLHCRRLVCHRVDQGLTVCAEHRLFHFLFMHYGALAVVIAHHVKKDRSDIFDPFMQACTGVF